MNILFICNRGENRSKTAVQLFSGSFKTDSAGLYSGTPVTETQLTQADVIVVMEDRHRTEIGHRFPSIYLQKRILVLGILDIYRYGQPELVRLLKVRMNELLESSARLIEKKEKAAASSPLPKFNKLSPPQHCRHPSAGCR